MCTVMCECVRVLICDLRPSGARGASAIRIPQISTFKQNYTQNISTSFRETVSGTPCRPSRCESRVSSRTAVGVSLSGTGSGRGLRLGFYSRERETRLRHELRHETHRHD